MSATRDRLLTPKQAAEMLAVSVNALDHHRRVGNVPFVRLGRLVRYSERQLCEWIERNSRRDTA